MGLATRKVLALVDICSLVSSSILFTQLGRRKRYKGYSFESSTCAGQMEVIILNIHTRDNSSIIWERNCV